jgi:leucine dehydrogenase
MFQVTRRVAHIAAMAAISFRNILENDISDPLGIPRSALRMEVLMSVFEIASQMGTCEVHVLHDQETNLRAAVAIHDTRLGPAVGGTRMYAYQSGDEAIMDVVRLARGMTHKAALAGLPHGGGKAVIWSDAKRPVTDRRVFMEAFGRFVDRLGGRYITCEDSGTSTADMDIIRGVTKHVLGVSKEHGGSGDPSPFTALGVRRGIEAAVEVVLGKSDLKGLHVAIMGVGSVGGHLADELHKAGCTLTVADVSKERVDAIVARTGARVVSVDELPGVACDIYAPCALGGAINDRTVGELKCKIVGGAANNQLATREMGEILKQKGIFYAPDYAINSGGLINVAQEYKGYDAAASTAKVMLVRDTIAEIARRAQRSSESPAIVADKMVDEILANAGAEPMSTRAIPGTNGQPRRVRDTV